jgi:hypothetical protein
MAPSREDKKKFIGDLLKSADRYIKAAEYTDAMVEVNKALAVEPGNMYALAYNQRIKAALEERKKKEEADRVRKLSEEKNGAAKAAEPAEAEAADAVPSPAGSNEEDQYTIKQQRAQIERFKKEIESLRLKHQQEIAVLAAEVQEAKAAAKEAGAKYTAVVDDAEESYRRSEELYAEVVRLTEGLAEAKRETDARHEALVAEHKAELLRLESEHEHLVAEHKKDLFIRDQERSTASEDMERERQSVHDESEKLAADHRLEIINLTSEFERKAEAQKAEIFRLTAEVEQAHGTHEQDLQKLGEAQVEISGLKTALKKQEGYLKELTADDDLRRRALGESLLKAILDKLFQADSITAEEKEMMNFVRADIGMSDEEFAQLQTEARNDLYRTALRLAWDEGYITPEKADELAQLRRRIGISPESHFIIEDELRSAKKNR